ncbi:ATPase components of various ABC-type transport systems, contain duplicated ATPase [Streptococcus agalactiae]|nr:ATPase components of various ABC-type transport systems, contain duplicated ATPase [Streptococcus agalactiae]
MRAIDNVSFDIYEGEVFGLVGESGSGKTTVGRSILKLYDISDGEITFNGEK